MSEGVGEVIEIAEQLKAAPDLFPWVCLIAVAFIVWRCRKHIGEYFQTVINSKKEETMFHAQQNELIRNNTAALNNNTAALELVQKDREMLANIVKHHEQLSQERFAHLQTVMNQTRDTVVANTQDLAIIKMKVTGK